MTSALMAALEVFEAAEANLVKLERLWKELNSLIPSGIDFGGNPDYEDRSRAFEAVFRALPQIDGWKPEVGIMALEDIAQCRMAPPGFRHSLISIVEKNFRGWRRNEKFKSELLERAAIERVLARSYATTSNFVPRRVRSAAAIDEHFEEASNEPEMVLEIVWKRETDIARDQANKIDFSLRRQTKPFVIGLSAYRFPPFFLGFAGCSTLIGEPCLVVRPIFGHAGFDAGCEGGSANTRLRKHEENVPLHHILCNNCV